MKAFIAAFSLSLGLLSNAGLCMQEAIESTTASPALAAPKIAIVIDDLGYQIESGRMLSQLPYPLTLAVIPNTPHAHSVIDGAVSSGQEVILHVPMEPLDAPRWEQGLNTRMDDKGLKTHLTQILERYPSVRGINNHGGSKLTANLAHMTWVMQTLAEHQLFFLDSRTTHESRAIEAAEASRVRHATRDVFLDNIQNESAIELQFEKLKEMAQRHGSAIAIAHPYAVTLQQLAKHLPLLEQEGFELVFCSELLIEPEAPPTTLSLKTQESRIR